MLRRFLSVMAAACVFACASTQTTLPASQSEVDDVEVLPLERVRLYASGVGYFERSGKLSIDSGLPVPTGHLDDALKSLVVFNADDTLGSVSFPSRLSPAVARARAGLPADQEAVLSYDRLLVALRGQHVELVVEGPTSEQSKLVTGRVIDVVAVQPSHASYDHGLPHRVLDEGQQAAEEQERLQVLLLSEDGRILRLDASQLSAVRPLDDVVARRLHAALSARLATRSNQRQMLRLAAGKNEGRQVTLAYLAETPTWRASYRLLLDEKPTAKGNNSRLQAWALVHNDTDELWSGVTIELVDGRPNSFLFPITAPRYERRDLETPNRELSSVPQLSTTTPDAMWGDFSDYEGEYVSRVGSNGVSGIGSGGGGRGEGIGMGSVGRLGHGAGTGSGIGGGSDLLWAGDLRRRAGVVPTAKQATSVYRVSEELDLAPQHSAMVPFMQTPLAATPIVWFDGFRADAQRAVGVSNNTANTLPAGPLAVYGRGGFLGEAMLKRLKPGGRQFARIAEEPDAAIRAGRPNQNSIAKHVSFQSGSIGIHSFVTSKTTLHFDNQSGHMRRVYVALPVVQNARVQGCDDVDFDSTASRAFAVFELPAGNGQERELTTVEARVELQSSDALTDGELTEWIATLTLPEQERDVLRRSVPFLDAWQASKRMKNEAEVEMSALQNDLERLQTHLKTLGDSQAKDARSQLMQRILQHEDELSRARTRQRSLDDELERRREDFELALSKLSQFRDKILEARQQAQKKH